MKVLLIEEIAHDRREISKILTAAGHNVVLACSGVEGICLTPKKSSFFKTPKGNYYINQTRIVVMQQVWSLCCSFFCGENSIMGYDDLILGGKPFRL